MAAAAAHPQSAAELCAAAGEPPAEPVGEAAAQETHNLARGSDR